MKENKKTDLKQYKNDYDKEHYKQVKIKLKLEEYEDFKKNLKAENTNITEFFKKCIKNLKEIQKRY